MMHLSLNNQNILEKLMNGLFLFSFGYSFLYFFLLTSFLPVPGNGLLMTSIFTAAVSMGMAVAFYSLLREIIGICKAKSRDTGTVLPVTLKLLALVGAYLFWIRKGMSDNMAGIMLMIMLGVSSEKQKASTLLRFSFLCGTALVVLGFILSMSGIIDNHGGTAFGFIYRTDYACHLLFLLLIYCFYHDGSLSPAGEIGIFALFLYNLLFVGGKTADICMPLVVFATYWRHYRREGKIPFQDRGRVTALLFLILYLPVAIANRLSGRFVTVKTKYFARRCRLIAFPFSAALMISLTLLYHHIPRKWITAIPKLGSVWSRLQLGIVGFDIYPLRLFGSDVVSRGAGVATETVQFYYFLDSSYIKILLEYGLVVFVLILGIMTVLQFRLYRKKQFYGMFLMAVAALDCIMEHHLTDLSYNVFGALVLADLTPVPPEKGILSGSLSKRLQMRNRSEQERMKSRTGAWLKRSYLLLSVILLIPALITAYKITTWSGYTPKSEAVLLLPGSYMEGNISEDLREELNGQRVSSASSYLSLHEDAVCVISGTESERGTAENTLRKNGIAPERIYTDTKSVDLAAALAYADALIDREGLTDRKTVCTFETEQARVSLVARDCGTPVNALALTLKGTTYFHCFLNEQLQLVKYWITDIFGVSASADSAEDHENIRITLKDGYDPEKNDKLSHSLFTALKADWTAAHPEIALDETVIRAADYSTEISDYASQNSLPDVFLIAPNSVQLWSDWDLLADMTVSAGNSPQTEERFHPLLRDRKTYAFPSLLSAPVLIAYDTELWQEAGYEAFPGTWEELAEVNETFRECKYDSVLGFFKLSGGNVLTYLMPRIFAENCGTDWLDGLKTGKEKCPFLNKKVLDALNEVQRITESEVLTGYDSPAEAYTEGSCPAAVVTLDDLPALQKDPEKWAHTGFALLPVSTESRYGMEIAGTYYAVESDVPVISAKAAEDPEKLRACAEFCLYLTSESEARKTAEDCMAECLPDGANKMPNFIYYMNGSASGAIGSALDTWLKADPEDPDAYTPEEIANSMQNGYEKYVNIDFKPVL